MSERLEKTLEANYQTLQVINCSEELEPVHMTTYVVFTLFA